MITSPDSADAIHRQVRRIPRGYVSTYARIARAVGGAIGARDVGRALARLPREHDVPTHRIVSARGVPLCPRRGDSDAEQRAMLEQEGVEMDARGRVILEKHLWNPEL